MRQSKANSRTIEQQLDEQKEEQGGEDGLLAEVIEGEGDKQKITAKGLKARLKEIGKDPEFADERKALEDYAALLDKQTDAKSRLKAAQEDLDAKLDAKYPKLTEDEIKTLVVDDKWLTTLAAAVQGELDRVSQTLTGRIRQLAERYATPLPQLNRRGGRPRRPRGRTPQEDGRGMEVKPGYKQTEVGVIPEEWDVRPCSQRRFASRKRPSNPRSNPIRYYGLGSAGPHRKLDGEIDSQSTPHAEQRAISGKYVSSTGDIVYSKIRPYLHKAQFLPTSLACAVRTCIHLNLPTILFWVSCRRSSWDMAFQTMPIPIRFAVGCPRSTAQSWRSFLWRCRQSQNNAPSLWR